MGRGLFKCLVACAVLAALTVTSPARSQPLPRPIDDTPETCTVTSLSPAAAYVPVVDSGDELSVDLFVLADRGVDQFRTSELIRRAQKAYAPLNMKLHVVGFEAVELSGTDAQGLIDQAKSLLGGERPVGSDAVLVFTSVEMTSGALGSGVAGKADCVGGIEFPTTAFVVIEDDGVADDAGSDWYAATLSGHSTAKVTAHELAHLFGAHHQYANCAEGIPSEIDQGEASPCTLMFNDVGLVSLAFSAVEGTVVRGYALEHLGT